MPDLSDLWFFLVTFALLVGAGIGLPIPEEVPVISAGIWAANNHDLGPFRWLILPTCIVGIVISDLLLYGIGRFGGARLLQNRWVTRLFPPEKREQIEKNFHHYGVKILLLVRWVPGIRSPMFITAGLMRVPLLRFVIADSLAAGLGHSLLFFSAFWFGDQFRDLFLHAEEEVKNKLQPIIILSVLIAIGLFFLFCFWRRPVTTADPKDLPLIGSKVAAGIERLEHKTVLLGRGKDTVVERSQEAAVRRQQSEVRSQKSGNNTHPNENHELPAKEEQEKAHKPEPNA